MLLLKLACKCHAEGSTDLQCAASTGQCPCKTDEGYAGVNCDEAAPGYYGLPPKGKLNHFHFKLNTLTSLDDGTA